MLDQPCDDYCNLVTVEYDKKVLPHERKRHTDRSVSSTPSAALSGRGYLPWPGGTYLGVPPIWTWPGVPTLAGGIPTFGYPPSGPGWGTPLQVWTDKHL